MDSEPEVDITKRRLGSGSSSSSRTPTESSDESLSLSETYQNSGIRMVPNVCLPTLYEDEDNPVAVKIMCKKCLDIEAILRNFSEMHMKAFQAWKDKGVGFWEVCINTHPIPLKLSVYKQFRNQL